MSKLIQLSFVVCSLLILAEIGNAMILIDPGMYEVNALIERNPDLIMAKFNINTRSECRIFLTGPLSKSLSKNIQKFSGYKIKFRISRRFQCGIGSGELVAFGKETTPTTYVTNNLKPIERY